MIDRHCACAANLAAQLATVPGIEVCNGVVLNQVALSFSRFAGDPLCGEMTQAMEAALNADGKHFFRTAVWKGRRILRVSIISRQTGPADIDILIKKIRTLWAEIKKTNVTTR